MKSSLFSFLIIFAVTVLYGQSPLYLKQPYDTAVFSNEVTEVHFSWNHDGSTNYTLEIADEPTFSTPNSFNTSDNKFVLTQASLFPNVNYWRITSDFGTSIVRSFEIIDLNSFGAILYHIDSESNVVVSSGSVSLWGNKASALYDASQGTSSLRPNYKIDEINGYNTVHFGGASGASADYLSLNDFEINDTNFTYFSVSKQQTLNSPSSYLLGRGSPLSGVISGGTVDGGRSFGIVSAPSTDVIRVDETTHLNWSVRTAKFKSLYENGIKFTTIIGDSVSGLQFNTIGVRPDQLNLNFHGDLAEILIFNTSMSEVERSSVDNYLITKYHPYPDLGNDINTCATEVTLGPINDPAFNSVNWSTGENKTSITIDQNGWYWVETEAFDRIVRDSIYVEGLVPKPTLSQVNDTTICLFDTLTVGYTNTLPPGITATWHDGTTDPTIDVAETDTIHVLFSNTDGCVISSDTLIVTVNQFPATEGLGEDRTVCLNTELFFEYGTASSGPFSHLWGDASTDPSFEPTVVGTQDYTIEVTDGMGCTAFDTVEITLANIDGPVVDFTFDTVCPYFSHQFTDQSTPSSGDAISSYEWRLPEDTIFGSSISYIHSDSTSYVVELEVSTDAGCINKKRDTATFYQKPEITFTTTGICEAQQISFNGGQLTPTTINTWEWDFDDPASGLDNIGSGQNTTHIFEMVDDYDVQLIGTDINGCSDTTVQLISISPAPNADFSFEEVCEGEVIEFNNLSTIASGSINSYNWAFGDGTFSGQSEPQKLYNNNGTFSVTLSATGNNGCFDDITMPVKVHAFPTVDQNIYASCAGISSTLEDASYIPNGSVAEVYWSLNGATPINDFSIETVFENSGVQTVNQTVVSAFGCSSNENYSIEVDDFISADFTIDPSALLVGYPTSFYNLSIGALTSEWRFGTFGTSTEESLDFTFPDSAVGEEVTIELVVENIFSCRDSVELTLPVLSPRTDLAVTQLFLQESEGFYIVGIELANEGTTPVTSADLFLRGASADVIRETWEGELNAGEKEIYVFSASPSTTVPQNQTDQNYLCVEAQIKTPFEFEDENLSNNDKCEAISESSAVLIVPHPNPVENDLSIQLVLPFNEVGTLEAYNSQGQLVSIVRENEGFTKGLNSFKVNTELWQSGNYIIVYKGVKEQQTAKVVKL